MAEMYEVKITVLKRLDPSDVFERLPVTPKEKLETCELFDDGEEFISTGGMPEGFPCTAAWQVLYPAVRALAFGGNMPWYEEQGVAVYCCPDGLRPVVFKLERI